MKEENLQTRPIDEQSMDPDYLDALQQKVTQEDKIDMAFPDRFTCNMKFLP